MTFLEELASVWSLRLYSLLHLTNFTFFLPSKLYHEETSDEYGTEGFSSLIVFAIWFILYYAYKKFLNLVLRRMKYPMIERKRLIDGLWGCGFCVCSAIFLSYFAAERRDCPWRVSDRHRPVFLVHKTFYLHRAAVEVFSHGSWLRGWTSQLFASALPAASSQKSPGDALVTLLFYKACDTALLDACRLLVTMSRARAARRVAKLVFLLHFLNWVYIHILFVPGSLLFYNDSNRQFRTKASLWMWLVCEWLNSIRNKEFACMYSKQTLETSLFPRPSQEAVEFANILKKHRNCVNNNRTEAEPSVQKKKTELWQTIVCAMTMKKKLKKLRDGKQINKAADEDNSNLNQAVNEMYN